MESLLPRVRDLLARGVRMPQPAAVFVGDDVVPARISTEVTIHPGCRITGATTAIGSGSVLGEEAPLTLQDCQLGSNVVLKGGYATGAVFLDGANAGSGAHIRGGTILEEEAGVAHTVGLKQTILLPYVTTGSLVNFCDCLMGGGTSRKNHSEVGSAYVHFNFTPHQDKATASLIGDVPRGVMLDQAPIFLGGQGGLVGPSRIEYGCVIPAGVVWRHDALETGMILYPPAETPRAPRPYRMGVYRNAARIFRNNLTYLGNIRALREWYVHVRSLFMAGLYERMCWEGALRQLDAVHEERSKRLAELVRKLESSARQLGHDPSELARREADVQQRIAANWPRIEEALARGVDGAGIADREAFLEQIRLVKSQGYLKALPVLPPAVRERGSAWLQALVDLTKSAGDPVWGGN